MIPSRDGQLDGRLQWLSFLGAPVVWLVHFLLAYLLAEATCSPTTEIPGALTWWVLLIGGALFAAVNLALTLFAWRMARRAARDGVFWDAFMPRVGAGIGLLTVLAIVVETATLFFLDVCG